MRAAPGPWSAAGKSGFLNHCSRYSIAKRFALATSASSMRLSTRLYQPECNEGSRDATGVCRAQLVMGQLGQTILLD
jgi:hypothetical protein